MPTPKWDKPVKNVDEALASIKKGCKTLQFEHRLDPYAEAQISYRYEDLTNYEKPQIGNAGVIKVLDALKENKTCRKLDLSGNSMSTKGIMEVIDLLEKNSNIEVLYLEDNKLDDEDVEDLAEALRKNKSLKELCLSGNQITDEGAVALAKMLKYNENLKVLWLNRNKIRDHGAKALGRVLRSKNKSLESLYLEENLIREGGAKKLAYACSKGNLHSLSLGGNKIGAKGAKYFKSVIEKSKTLEQLVLDGNRMNKDDVDKLEDIAETKKSLDFQRRVGYERPPKATPIERMSNYFFYHILKPRYAGKGHFKPEKPIESVL